MMNYGEVFEITPIKSLVCPYCDFEDEKIVFLDDDGIYYCPNCEERFISEEKDNEIAS